MRKLETLFGILSGLAVGLLGFYAISLVAVLIYRGQAEAVSIMPPPPEPAAVAEADGGAADGGAAAVEASAGSAPAAAIDLAAGEKAFAACKACHTVTKDGRNLTGPHLWGIFDRPIASVEGFSYSADMAALADQIWDQAALDHFLTKPRDMVKGTKMTYAGMKDAAKRTNLIAFLAAQSDNPVTLAAAEGAAPAAEGTEETAAADTAPDAGPDAGPFDDLADDAIITLDPVPYPEDVTYRNPPPATEARTAEIAAKVAALEAELPMLDYERARHHPLHFPPAIETASNQECLVCHQEIATAKPRETSEAGVVAADSLAWYQTLDTYTGPQETFHWRHLESDFAKEVMQLDCTFCHKGNDPREESPDMMPGRAAFAASATPEFTLRKMVNPSETCLLCHGAFPDPENIMGLIGPWPEARVDLETAEAPNGCLTCHAETFRTNRHEVNYLNAANIEDMARNDTSDSCYGCHGGRQWYNISYPYPRHAWPMMDTETVPDWAADRPTESKPEYQLAPVPEAAPAATPAPAP